MEFALSKNQVMLEIFQKGSLVPNQRKICYYIWFATGGAAELGELQGDAVRAVRCYFSFLFSLISFICFRPVTLLFITCHRLCTIPGTTDVEGWLSSSFPQRVLWPQVCSLHSLFLSSSFSLCLCFAYLIIAKAMHPHPSRIVSSGPSLLHQVMRPI